MTTTTEPILIHFLADVTLAMSTSSFGDSRLVEFGSELEVTPEIIEANRDRLGRSWLADWLDSGEHEYRRGGKVIARRGPWPAGTCRLQPGGFAWHAARDQALRELFEVADPALRAQQRRELDSYYGPAPATSRTLMTTTPGAAQ